MNTIVVLLSSGVHGQWEKQGLPVFSVFVFLYYCFFVFLRLRFFCYHKVYLDSESSSVYGLMVTGMEVTDTRDQSEPILVNGWDTIKTMIIMMMMMVMMTMMVVMVMVMVMVVTDTRDQSEPILVNGWAILQNWHEANDGVCMRKRQRWGRK